MNFNRTAISLSIVILSIIMFVGAGSAETNVIPDPYFTQGGWTHSTNVNEEADPYHSWSYVKYESNSAKINAKISSSEGSSSVYQPWVSTIVYSLLATDTLTFTASSSGTSGSYSQLQYQPVLEILIDDTQIDTRKGNQLGWGGGSDSVSVTIPSNYRTSGTHTIKFRLHLPDTPGTSTFNKYSLSITNVQILQKTTPPTLTEISAVGTPTMSESSSFNIYFTPGDFPSDGTAKIQVYFGDDTDIETFTITSQTSSPITVTHTYNSYGTTTISALGVLTINNYNYVGDTVTLTTTVSIPKPSGSAYITDSEYGSSPITTANVGSTVWIRTTIAYGNSNTKLLKIYKDGVQYGNTITVTDYQNAYPVTLPSTAGTYTYSLKATNDAGESTITMANNGQLTLSTITVPTINAIGITSGSNTGDIPFLVSVGVEYTKGGADIEYFTWNFGDGAIVRQDNNFGVQSHTYTTAGNYTVTVNATNAGGTSATITLLQTINATQPGATPTPTSASGSGGMYASTFATIYVLNKADGTSIPNIKVTGSATAATAASWIGDLFGQIWGDRVVGSEVSGYTDAQGAITFPVFTSVKYYITITDVNNTVTQQPNRLDKDKYEYSFTPSALTTPYQYYVNLANTPIVVNTNNIETSVQVSNSNGQITVMYTDPTQYTTHIKFDTYLKDASTGNWTRQDYLSTNVAASLLNVTMQIQSYSGKDFMFILVGESPYFEPIERTYYKTFSGPRLSFGIPDSMYIWICFITALILGGVATYLSSPATCFLIVFVEWIYWFFGWFFAIDDLLVPGASAGLLVFATIMSIAYYISSRK